MTTGGWWTTDGNVRHRRADGTSASACGRESGPMHPAANWLTACDDCNTKSEPPDPTEGRPLSYLPNGHRQP
jgi:hypothetical protein